MKRARMIIVGALSLMLLGALAAVEPKNQVELPNAAPIDGSARIVRVGPNDDLQQALDRAVAGDIIELQAGAVYKGPFVLQPHTGDDRESGWITITSRSDGAQQLPPAGTRVTPRDVSAMASLTATKGSVISTAAGASWYHFIGVEIRPDHRSSVADYVTGAQHPMTNLVDLGAGNNSVAQMPHHIVIERSYLHGDPVRGTRRGVAMNGAHMAVIDSHLADFKSTEDSQAIAGWEGTGPFLISNNYLEAAGENVMFGGADPSIKNRVPSDITVTGNHFSKPLSWHTTDPGYDGSNWTVKNLLELKNAQRVLIDGNLFEHNWPQAQNGFAILFTVRNQDGGSPWSRVEEVTFSNNIVRRVAAGINILGYDDIHGSERTQDVSINNNLFYDIGGLWGNGRLLQLLNSPASIALTHNTALQSEAILFMEGDPIPDVDISHNIFMDNSVGISGTGTAPGLQSIENYLAPPVVMQGNILIGSGEHQYPPGLIRVNSIADLPFFDPALEDFRLQDVLRGVAADSPEAYGVDFRALCAALSVTERPLYC